MRVLALDSSAGACSVAIIENDVVLAHRSQEMARGQAEAMMPMIAEIMAEAGCSFADLSLIGVTVGPGAFTGLRIALAAARGMAVASGLPIAGITTTRAIAHAVPVAHRQGCVVVAGIDSRRAEGYFQWFAGDDLNPLSEIEALTPQQAAAQCDGNILLAGEAVSSLAPFVTQARTASTSRYVDARIVALLALSDWQKGVALPPVPLYMRPPDVTVPR